MSEGRSAADRQTVVPYLFVEDADGLIGFCRTVFGAELRGRLTRPSGSVMHAEIRIGDSVVMIGEPMGEFDPAPAWVFVTVDDSRAVYDRAIEAGGTSVMEVTEWNHAGERYGGVVDPFGNTWWISTPTEDVSWNESQRRIDALVEQELGE